MGGTGKVVGDGGERRGVDDDDNDDDDVVAMLLMYFTSSSCRERMTQVGCWANERDGALSTRGAAVGDELAMAMAMAMTTTMTWWPCCHALHVVVVVVSRPDEVGCGVNERDGERRVVKRSGDGQGVDDDDDDDDVVAMLPRPYVVVVVSYADNHPPEQDTLWKDWPQPPGGFLDLG